jgi:hypothetical protein
MIVLGCRKLGGIDPDHRRRHGLAEYLLDLRLALFGLFGLIRRGRKYGGGVAFAPVAELAAGIQGVDRPPKIGHQLRQTDLGRIIGHPHHLAVSGSAG